MFGTCTHTTDRWERALRSDAPPRVVALLRAFSSAYQDALEGDLVCFVCDIVASSNPMPARTARDMQRAAGVITELFFKSSFGMEAGAVQSSDSNDQPHGVTRSERRVLTRCQMPFVIHLACQSPHVVSDVRTWCGLCLAG